jgi:hypothetical protein
MLFPKFHDYIHVDKQKVKHRRNILSRNEHVEEETPSYSGCSEERIGILPNVLCVSIKRFDIQIGKEQW